MSIVPAADAASTSILVSDLNEPASTCKPYARVPFAIDAAVVAFNIDGVGNLTLTPQLAEEILSGKVTDWSDPKIATVNPGFEFTPGPITVVGPTQSNTLDAFTEWMSRLAGHSFAHDLLTPVESTDPAEVLAIPSGGVALVPFSHAALNFAMVASIQTTSDSMMLANPDAVGIATAGTQLKIAKSTNRVVVELNPSAKPTAPDGIDEVPTPYQAIYSVDMSLCGDESLTTRAAARFLLRQDSQGSLGASFMLPLPERVRVESLAEVSKGLNIVIPTDLPQE
jgi:phosphate transport system substrate-binding protein